MARGLGLELVADGHRLEYRMVEPDTAQAQHRNVLVLLHEGLGSVALWKDFPDALAARTGHRVLAYSRYGYGRSAQLQEPRPVDYMHREALVVLPQVLARLDITRPTLIGHSDGASIAIIHAGGGHAVAGMVLVAPHVFVETCTVDSIAEARRSFDSTDLVQRLARYHEHPRSMFLGWNDVWLKREFREWNIETYVSECNVPLLLIQGEQDPYGTVAQIEAIERRAGGKVDKVLLADCAHSPHRERPQETIEAIARFVDVVDASSAD